MSQNFKFLRRVILIALFLSADIILGMMWLRQQKQENLVPIKKFLYGIHPALPETVLGKLLSASTPSSMKVEVLLTPQEIHATLNEERAIRKLPELTFSEVLSQAGEKIITALQENDLNFDTIDSSKILTTFLQQKKVQNVSLFHDTLIGPLNTDQLVHYWGGDSQHQETIASPDLTQVGVATGSATVGGQLQGIIVTIYAKPQVIKQQEVTTQTEVEKIVFPSISDTSILEALNIYRATHKVHQLVEHSNLCEYAQKRVKDLLEHGGLDNHEGFKKDFADSKNLPQSIKDYPGGAVGENLAYQHCKNMTTGDSFIAQNATALIEWCFDSSTKGHREAQLNPRYNNVCSRHQDGYFVIIFGE